MSEGEDYTRLWNRAAQGTRQLKGKKGNEARGEVRPGVNEGRKMRTQKQTRMSSVINRFISESGESPLFEAPPAEVAQKIPINGARL